MSQRVRLFYESERKIVLCVWAFYEKERYEYERSMSQSVRAFYESERSMIQCVLLFRAFFESGRSMC